MDSVHLLNLRVLADAEVGDYALLRFDGREAISECFDYRLEFITKLDPEDLSGWIGKLVEFDVTPKSGDQRVFAGRIYEVQVALSGDLTSIRVRARPAYHATAYGRATHFIQDKSSKDIFEAMTADVPGLTTAINMAPTPPVRGYSTRYDESEYDFLQRLLAQDGIMYFFRYDRGAGPYRHKMFVSSATADYIDVPGADALYLRGNDKMGTLGSIDHLHRAAPRTLDHHAFNVNALDTPWTKNTTASDTWGKVYAHNYESIGAEAVATGDLAARSTPHTEARAQSAEIVSGSSDNPMFAPAARIGLAENAVIVDDRLVLVSVNHSAYDPWMLPGAGPAEYHNSFTAMDAAKVCRPLPPLLLRAPGPVLGKVAVEGAAEGEAKIDDKSRIPVAIALARDYAGAKPLNKVVWLPVQQQWAAGTHGAQFFPRIGTRVIIDFLYGNPDLPFVAGTVYTPSQKYPFDPASMATQTGWRSVTDKNGNIKQEFHFEDKPGEEEIYLYTGRDYRRLIDNDDWGTVKRDQTLIVERDQKLTVNKDRTVVIEGLEKIDITQTQTVTVTDKVLYESKAEIVLKVGSSTITMKPTSIEIKSVKIDIIADAKVSMSGGAAAEVKAPKVDVLADAMLTLQGGIVKIN